MSAFSSYEEIFAWQVGRELVKLVYELTSTPAVAKDFGLRDQIQRAAVSICSNIAEGFERRGNKEFVQYLWIARGSAAEVSSQLYHFKDLGYLSDETFADLYARTKTIRIAISRLIKSISKSSSSSKESLMHSCT